MRTIIWYSNTLLNNLNRSWHEHGKSLTNKQTVCTITMCIYAPNGSNNNENLDFKLDMTHTKYNDHRQLFEHGSATQRKKRNTGDDDLLHCYLPIYTFFSSFDAKWLDFCDGMQIKFDHWPSIKRVIISGNEEKKVFFLSKLRGKKAIDSV